MSYIKIPTWLDVAKHSLAFDTLKLLKPFSKHSEQSFWQLFWKEQALRFGFDIRNAEPRTTFELQNKDQTCFQWKSFFYQKLFEYTLKRIGNSIENLKVWEKYFWQTHGRYIEKLELSSGDLQNIEQIISWCPNIRHLVLKKCNTLLQVNLTPLKNLQVLELYNIHLITDKTFVNIPPTLHELIITSSKSITNEFFDKLSELQALTHLSVVHCPCLQLHQLSKLPKGLLTLDISRSGASIVADRCFYLPRSLQALKMNGWDHFTNNELALLPPNLTHLEIEGWQVTAEGLHTLSSLPLTILNISRIGCDDFNEGLQQLPSTLKMLKLAQNAVHAADLQCLTKLALLEDLDLSFTLGYEGKLDEAAIAFPKSLNTLNLAYCGALHKNTIHSLKALNNLKSLKISGCQLENSDLEWLPSSLEIVDLSLCSNVTDVGLILLGGLHQLHTLCLDGCDQIRGFGLSKLAPSVKNLSLAGLHRLSGKSLVQLPACIEELSLDSCELIMLDDIQALPLSLQVLTLARCPNIGNEACDFLSSLPCLTTLSLQECPKITEIATAKLIRRKFEGTLIIKSDVPKTSNGITSNVIANNAIKSVLQEGCRIELHPPVSMLRKLTNFKARLIYKLKNRNLKVQAT